MAANIFCPGLSLPVYKANIARQNNSVAYALLKTIEHEYLKHDYCMEEYNSMVEDYVNQYKGTQLITELKAWWKSVKKK